MNFTSELFTKDTVIGVVGVGDSGFMPHERIISAANLIGIACHSIVITDEKLEANTFKDLEEIQPFASIAQSITNQSRIYEPAGQFRYSYGFTKCTRDQLKTGQHTRDVRKWLEKCGVNLLLGPGFVSREPELLEGAKIVQQAAYRTHRFMRLLRQHPKGTYRGSWATDLAHPISYSLLEIGKNIEPAGLAIQSHELVSEESKSTV